MEKFVETWSSLKRHETPQWLDDCKFGIYFHWGVYSVPAYGNEWYPHHMYNPKRKEFKFHTEHFGHPSKFGYKDLIPFFKAEHFDADAWVKMFKDAGAQFAGPVAEHHDGFSMWNSEVNPWNAKKMGPQRDVVGEIAQACRKYGLKLITTFHHSRNWYFFNHRPEYDTSDPKFAQLYGPAHPIPNEGYSNEDMDRPSEEFCDVWFTKIKEVVDNYEPDLIWFDFGLQRIPDKYKRKMAAYYYNKALEWGKEVEIIYKHHNLPPGLGLLDYERSSSNKMTYNAWITDTFLGTKSWSYVDNEVYKDINYIIANFIDRVAKHGYLLMNIGPKADGTIPQPVQQRLKQLGEWFEVHKNAIIGTTPWVKAEEGKLRLKRSGGFNEPKNFPYNERDLRFLAKNNSLYVFGLQWPKSGMLMVKSLIAAPGKKKIKNPLKIKYIFEPQDIQSISLVETGESLEWDLTPKGLIISLPSKELLRFSNIYAVEIQWT